MIRRPMPARDPWLFPQDIDDMLGAVEAKLVSVHSDAVEYLGIWAKSYAELVYKLWHNREEMGWRAMEKLALDDVEMFSLRDPPASYGDVERWFDEPADGSDLPRSAIAIAQWNRIVDSIDEPPVDVPRLRVLVTRELVAAGWRRGDKPSGEAVGWPRKRWEFEKDYRERFMEEGKIYNPRSGTMAVAIRREYARAHECDPQVFEGEIDAKYFAQARNKYGSFD